jgi:transposase-like protein
MAHKPRTELAKSELFAELPVACATEAAAVEFLERKRWAAGACCPLCGSVSVYTMKDRAGARSKRFLWRCRDCSKMYTVRTGTIYAESLIPLHKWLRAMWEAASAKNCVSALEMSRKLELSYKSTLFLMHRIRHTMAPNTSPDPKLTGTVEADETYVGGRPRHRRTGITGNHPGKPKTPVFAAVQRGGEVRAQVLPSVTANNLRIALTDCVDLSARLVTDDLNLYWNAGKPFARHDKVAHSKKEYVNKADPSIHSNTIESFFARVKRGLNGTFHAVSKEHLHRYVDGFAFLYNTRELTDGERTLSLLRRTEGKRLMYKQTA